MDNVVTKVQHSEAGTSWFQKQNVPDEATSITGAAVEKNYDVERTFDRNNIDQEENVPEENKKENIGRIDNRLVSTEVAESTPVQDNSISKTNRIFTA